MGAGSIGAFGRSRVAARSARQGGTQSVRSAAALRGVFGGLRGEARRGEGQTREGTRVSEGVAQESVSAPGRAAAAAGDRRSQHSSEVE